MPLATTARARAHAHMQFNPHPALVPAHAAVMTCSCGCSLQIAPCMQELWGHISKEVELLRHPPEPPGGSLEDAHAPPGPLSHAQALTVRLAAMHVLRHRRRFGRSPVFAAPPPGAPRALPPPPTELLFC